VRGLCGAAKKAASNQDWGEARERLAAADEALDLVDPQAEHDPEVEVSGG
jgi:hypothetical protein